MADDLVGWGLSQWAPGSVLVVATAVLGFLVRTHGRENAASERTRRRLNAELSRIEVRNDELAGDLGEMHQREREWVRERVRLEERVAELEAEVSRLRGRQKGE